MFGRSAQQGFRYGRKEAFWGNIPAMAALPLDEKVIHFRKTGVAGFHINGTDRLWRLEKSLGRSQGRFLQRLAADHLDAELRVFLASNRDVLVVAKSPELRHAVAVNLVFHRIDGVSQEDNFAVGSFQARVQRFGQTSTGIVTGDTNLGELSRQFSGNFLGPIRRTIVDDQHLELIGQLRQHVQHGRDVAGQGVLGVVDRQKYTD